MSFIFESISRCFRAIQLTLRFVVKRSVSLAFLLVAVCLLFGNGYEPAVSAGSAILVVYFTLAYYCYGRSESISRIIAALAGLDTREMAPVQSITDGAGHSSDGYSTSVGLATTGGGYAAGNTFGFATASVAEESESISMFDDADYGINPMNGLPMMDGSVDVHGNLFGTNSADDMFNANICTDDDSTSHAAFDDSFSYCTFDDDWNN